MISALCVEVLDDAHSWTGIGAGFKVGMRVPGVASVGTVRSHGEKVFVAAVRALDSLPVLARE